MDKNMAEDGVEENRENTKKKELGGLRTMPFILGELASSSSVLLFLFISFLSFLQVSKNTSLLLFSLGTNILLSYSMFFY